MAVVRARSSPPYGLITFVVLWVITLGAAVFLYVTYNKTQRDLASAQNDLKTVGTKAERDAVNIDFPPANNSQSTLGAVSLQYNQLRKDVIGSPNATTGDISAQLNDALASAGKSVPAIQAIRQLAAQHKTDDEMVKKYAAQVALVSSQLQDVRNTSDEQIKSLNKTLADRETDLAGARADAAKSQADLQAAVKANEDALAKAAADLEANKRQSILVQDQQKSDIDRLNKDNIGLRELLASSKNGKNIYVGESDGNIVKVNPADEEVYINLGDADRMVPGLTFTVYDPRLGVRFGTAEEAAGKASVEVIQVFDHSALCRITRTTKDQHIQAGDLISNVAYHNDKNRKFHFVIYGDFDLDGDGVATANERDRLARMITKWGGIIDKEVTTQTDYVVMGDRPASPTNAQDATVPGSPASQRAADIDKYDAIQTSAQELNIPVLNANRFLNMIGYYNTSVVRY